MTSGHSPNFVKRWWRKVTTTCDRFEDHRTRVRIAMAIVALLSAGAAFRATELERASVTCDHLSEAAQTYQLVQRQRYLDAAIEHQRWSRRYSVATHRADRLLGRADSIRHQIKLSGADVVTAGLFDEEAQIEHAVARMLIPVRNFTNPKLGNERDLDARLRVRAEGDVKEFGIPRTCPTNGGFTPDKNPEKYLDPLQTNVAYLHELAIKYATIVIGLVIVLMLFTLSRQFQRLLQSILEFSAMALLVVSAFIVVKYGDLEIIITMSVITIVLVFLFGTAWSIVKVWNSKKLGGETDRRNMFILVTALISRVVFPTRASKNKIILVAVLIEATAVSSALLTWRYLNEGGGASKLATKAAVEHVELLRSSSREAAEAYQTIDAVVAARESRLREVAAKELWRHPARGGFRANGSIWDYEKRLSELTLEALKTASDPNVIPNEASVDAVLKSATGPERDPAFPALFFVGATTHDPAEHLAKWAAYDQASTISEGHADILLAVAAFFLLALYLFAQCRTELEPSENWLLFPGILLFVLGWVSAALVLLQPVPAVERSTTLSHACRKTDVTAYTMAIEAAATCYALAQSEAALNHNDVASNAYKAASQENIGPVYTPAFNRESYATVVQIAAAERLEPVSIERAKLLTLVAEERHAAEVFQQRDGETPRALLDSLGFHEYLLATDVHDRDQSHEHIDSQEYLDASSRHLTLADDDSKEPRTHLHLAVVRLAAGYRAAAHEHYDAALQDERASGDTKIAAINDLERLRHLCGPRPQRAAAPVASNAGWKPPICMSSEDWITPLESMIFRTLWSVNAPVTPATLPSGAVKAYPNPGGIGFQFSRTARLDKNAKIAVVVYQNDPGLAPRVISASGQVESLKDFKIYHDIEHPKPCLQGGTNYSLEIRVGETVRVRMRKKLPGAAVSFNRVVLHDQGIAMCLPGGADGWAATAKNSPDHFEAAFADDGADAAQGADLFAYFTPRHAAPETRDLFLKRAIFDTLNHHHWQGHEREPLRLIPHVCEPWLAVDDGDHAGYSFPPFELLVRRLASNDGLFHVAVVWRNAAAAPEGPEKGCNVLASISSIDDTAHTDEP